MMKFKKYTISLFTFYLVFLLIPRQIKMKKKEEFEPYLNQVDSLLFPLEIGIFY